MAQMSTAIDDVPGTIRLVDVDQTAAERHVGAAKDILLVPTPSNDANDPLNWSVGRKRMQLFCILL